MSSVLEKSVLTIYRMKKLQEKLYYADNLKLESLKDMYIDEIFILYNQSQVEIRNCISFTDLQKYETKTFKISNYKIITESDKKLKIQYFINNKSYIMNSHVPFYGKTSENKIFINNIKKIS